MIIIRRISIISFCSQTYNIKEADNNYFKDVCVTTPLSKKKLKLHKTIVIQLFSFKHFDFYRPEILLVFVFC